MATFRVGVGSFNINDGSVGIGTEGSGHGNLKVEGTIKSKSIDVLGVSTFTRYSGFSADNVNINNRDLTLSGEYSTTGDVVVEDGASLTVGLGSTACIGTVESVSVKNHFSVPYGDTIQRNESSGYSEGTVRYNTDLGTMEFFNGNEWRQFTYIVDIKNSSSTRGRGLYCGGFENPNQTNAIDFIEISTLGNAQNFGDLTVAREGCGRGTISSAIRGLSMAGWDGSGTNEIDYLTIASEGNSIDFGDATNARGWGGGMSSSTRGLLAGGYNPATVNIIDYVEIMTLGDALDFGDLTTVKESTVGMASPTRGIIGPGMSPSFVSEIDFITIASKGNSTIFGDMDSIRGLGAAANTVRGLLSGGKGPDQQNLSQIFQITLASEGNATEFGELISGRRKPEGVSNSTRACFGGGNFEPSGRLNIIDFVTISSAGDAVNFGDLTHAREVGNSNSDSHGGLGGY